MNVMKFFAGTSRQALAQIRKELGEDALILSNKSVNNGVEILAMAKNDLPALNHEDVPHNRQAVRESRQRPAPLLIEPETPTPPQVDPMIRNLMSEIKAMRGIMEEQHVAKEWNTAQQHDPGKIRLLSDMLRSGFSPAITRQFLGKMPAGLATDQKLGWVRAVLDRNLRTVNLEDEIVERGGVYALVGPTGVGKTTTVAKIAARCVARYGADRIALLTTDSYRIGAHEQLRIYGKLLGVRVMAIKDAPDLQYILDDLRGKSLVLIDTVGMSQRDQMVAEQLAMLSGTGAEVQRLLLLNATCSADTLEDVVRVYQSGGIHGCIITKTDEAISIATPLDIILRHKLSLHYIANGQRVPEDLHLPDREYLLGRALRPISASSPYQMDVDEYQLLMTRAGLDKQSMGGLVV